MDPKTKTILIVEDEKPLINALSIKLKEEGFNVFQAGNGEEALNVGYEQKPDLVLLDLKMPHMDGVTYMQNIRSRQEEWGKQVKVIILTNLRPDETIINGLAGMDPSYYLIKAEWTIADIVGKVKEVLS